MAALRRGLGLSGSSSAAAARAGPHARAEAHRSELVRIFLSSYVRGIGFVSGVLLAAAVLSRDSVLVLLVLLPLLLQLVARASNRLKTSRATPVSPGLVRVGIDFLALLWSTLTWFHLST